MLKVGVTGGIGCGKSAVTDHLASKGIVIADADQAARAVVEPGEPALQAITERLGCHLLLQDGSLNRRALRDIIFNHLEHRQWLEQLIHPLVKERLIREMATATSPYVILAAPLLFEAQLEKTVDRVLVIDTDPELQIQRTMARDNTSRSHVEAIIGTQLSRERRLEAAADIIYNNGTLAELQQKLDELHHRYLIMTGQNRKNY